MTCIVGLETPNGVIIGGDSAGVNEDYDLEVRADEKVFARRGGGSEWVFGFTSSFRMGQLVRYALKLPDVPKRDSDLDKFMVTKVVDAVRTCFREGGFLAKKDGVEEGGSFLVTLRGRLYAIHDDLQVARAVKGYTAVGCGESYAKGVMYATPRMAPEKRVRLALEAAEQFSGGVRAPFHIIGPIE